MSALCLAACASPQSAEPNSHQVFGDSSFATVEYGGDPDHAAPFAEQYCAQYGKKAQLKGIKLHHHGRYASGIDVTFNCVALG
jgi:hypothetical protein